MRYRYYFCKPYRKELVDYLENHQLSYQTSGRFIKFDLWSTTTDIETHLRKLKEITFTSPLIFPEYTEAEYNSAKLLVMQSQLQTTDILNEDEAYRYNCQWTNSVGMILKRHESQVAALQIAKEPSSKTRTAFWCESTGFSVLFADSRLKELVKKEGIQGLVFQDVILKNGERSSRIFQATSQQILDEPCIKLGFGEKRILCPQCGKPQYAVDRTYQLHVDFSKIPDELDFYMTAPIFGEGPPESLYVISQRFFRCLNETKLADHLTFTPVVEV